MLSSKKSGLKGTLRQAFIRVARLEIQSVLWVFSSQLVDCCHSNLLSGSTLPPPPFPVLSMSLIFLRATGTPLEPTGKAYGKQKGTMKAEVKPAMIRRAVT
jgi:hypothetical protein